MIILPTTITLFKDKIHFTYRSYKWHFTPYIPSNNGKNVQSYNQDK